VQQITAVVRGLKDLDMPERIEDFHQEPEQMYHQGLDLIQHTSPGADGRACARDSEPI
jgi:hypothetical protein